MPNKNNLQKIKEEFENGVIELDEIQVKELEKLTVKLREKDGCFVTDPTEKYAYNLLKKIIIPTLDDYVRANNPTAYESYHGNMCRHASLVACHALKKILPTWNWDVYEITYSASIYDKPYTCTHAFVIGERYGEYRAVDMWDDLNIQFFAPIDSVRYPFEYDEIEKDRVVISMNKLSYDEMIQMDDELLLGNVPKLLEQLDVCIEISELLGILK